MLREKKTRTNIGVGVGFVFLIAGVVLVNLDLVDEATAGLWLTLVLVGAVFFIWGCTNYAEGKGHSHWLGLLGLLFCVGLIILILLPDHHRESK